MATSKTAFALLRRLAAVLLLSCVLFLAVAWAILGGEAKFGDTYQSVIQRKYDQLIHTRGPKIVIIGGSNAGFGFDSVRMTEETGYPTINMGLHAGFGPLFNTEIAKNHIHEGDILLIAHEYGIKSSVFEKLGDIDLIMKGIDTRLEMYREIPLKNLPEILSKLFNFAVTKAEKTKTASGVYSSGSFDAYGNMVLERESCIIVDYENKQSIYGRVYGNSLLRPDDDLEYLVELREYVESRGASVYFLAPVLMAEAYEGTEQNLLDYAAEIQRRTGIEFICNPYDYVFPSEYMFDTIYHCNEKGEQLRTELVIRDLRAHGIVD